MQTLKNLFLLIGLFGSIPIAFAENRFIYDDRKVDVGYLYSYDYSENQNKFIPEFRKYYWYVVSSTTIEALSVIGKSNNSIIDINKNQGMVGIDKFVMDWNNMVFVEREFTNYTGAGFTWDARFSGAKSLSTVRDFSLMTERDDNYLIQAGKPETFLKPVHLVATVKIDPLAFPEYSGYSFNPELGFALRFLDSTKSTAIYITRDGYSVKVDVVPQGFETIEYKSQNYHCRKFDMVPSGIIGHLFGKRSYIWCELDSGYNYVVRMRDENNPFRQYQLAERRPMSGIEWDNFKSNMLEKLQK